MSTSKRGAKIAVVLVTSLLCVGLLEVGLRIALPHSRLLDRYQEPFWKARYLERLRFDDGNAGTLPNVTSHPVLGWLPRKGLSRHEGKETTNSAGLRGSREYDLERDGGERWMILGDSFSYGLGIQDDAIYATHLESKLGENGEVLNLGVNGFGTDQELLYWREFGVRYRPDLVILAFYIPNVHRLSLSFRELPKPRFRLEGDKLTLEGVPVQSEEALRTSPPEVDSRPLRILDALASLSRRLTGESEAVLEEKCALLQAIVRAMRDEVRQTGAKFAIVVIPHHWYGEYPGTQKIVGALRTVADEGEVPLLDLTATLTEHDSGESPLYGSNDHFTERGHRVAADAIYSFLK